MITLLLLTVRPGIAVVTCLAISLVPAASGLILLGHVPEGVATYTPYELGNVVYLAIFVGVRIQLEHLHASEREEHAQRVRQMRVSAQLEQHAAMSRLVHDEVLASLFAAMHTDGAPSSLQSRDARRVIAELDAASPDPSRAGSAAAMRRRRPSGSTFAGSMRPSTSTPPQARDASTGAWCAGSPSPRRRPYVTACATRGTPPRGGCESP